jgi:hypothetical protein
MVLNAFDVIAFEPASHPEAYERSRAGPIRRQRVRARDLELAIRLQISADTQILERDPSLIEEGRPEFDGPPLWTKM